jgi:fumarate reductase flavoprotein subunit
VPAAGTRFQRAKGIDDNAALFASDIVRKSSGEADADLVRRITESSASVVEWLADRHGFPFEVIDNFDYPGHSARRMHGLPTRSGAELIDRLRSAVEGVNIPILTGSRATTLFVEGDGAIRGLACDRGGAEERIGCNALILACCGFGGNRALVRRFIPEMADALYFGHPGNEGDAIMWGEQLGAQLTCMSAYQGHGSVAVPHSILITWALITEGGFQVNSEGSRFSDESRGYSEQAAEVLRQPGAVAFVIFDERLAAIARQFPDFRNAERSGAVLCADSITALANRIGVPPQALAQEFANVTTLVARGGSDRFGRSFAASQVLEPPLLAVKVTGALFHTQGGLAVDRNARVRRPDGTVFPNLFAAGGAAAGVSGNSAKGYLSGNGLLTATVLGRLAGTAAASLR